MPARFLGRIAFRLLPLLALVVNPSLMTVSAMLSLVTATGLSSTEGMSPVPLLTDWVAVALKVASSPVARASASFAAVVASSWIDL